MNKEFIPYEQALALKELGFEYVSTIFAYDEAKELYTRDGIPHDFNIRGLLSAPTFSQAFRWFREKYFHHAFLEPTSDSITENYCFKILDQYSGKGYSKSYVTYEEAELECLVKLIDIVKKQNLKG